MQAQGQRLTLKQHLPKHELTRHAATIGSLGTSQLVKSSDSVPRPSSMGCLFKVLEGHSMICSTPDPEVQQLTQSSLHQHTIG